MDLGIAGKVAIVSGASAGVGRVIASQLAEEGVSVVLTARGEDRLKIATADITNAGWAAKCIAADMTKAADIRKVVQFARDQFSDPEIIVSNVQPLQSFSFDDSSNEGFEQVFQDLVMSVVHLTRETLPFMKSKSWGRYINVGSVCMKEPHRFYNLVFSNTGRAGVLGLNKSLANEFAPFGITANVIALGLIDTGRIGTLDGPASQRGAPLVEPMPRIPAGRPGTPEEVASLCLYLSSAAASYVTGQVIAVDGGWTRGLM